ncbi:hypothetical protein J2Z29_002496 [Treponema pedis]
MSSVECRVSSVECRVSSVECRVSSVECRVNYVARFEFVKSPAACFMRRRGFLLSMFYIRSVACNFHIIHYSTLYIIAQVCRKNKEKGKKNVFLIKGERETPVPSRVFSLPLRPPLSFPHGLGALPLRTPLTAGV